MSKPKILVLDIETAPMHGQLWDLWDQTLGLDQIEIDWHLMSWAAIWFDKPTEIFYMDQRNQKDMHNDTKILKGMWNLLNECDIVLTQNGKKFDVPKLNAKFAEYGFGPTNVFRHFDTCQIAKKLFKFTSNKLEYLAKILKTKHQKLKHKKYPGHEMWKECLKRNPDAWAEMEKYNKHDVLVTAEVFEKLRAWDNSINFNVYQDDNSFVCNCGSTELLKNGHHYSDVGKFQRYKCKQCGAPFKDRTNLLTKDKMKSLKVPIKR